MQLCWEQMQVQFIHGGGAPWHPSFELTRQWFKRHLVDYDLWYIWHGEGYLRDTAGDVTPLRAGMCLLMRPGSVFHVWQKPGTGFATRYFHFELFDAAGRPIPPDAFIDLPVICEVRDPRYFDTLTRRLTDLIVMTPLMPGGLYLVDPRQVISTLLKTVLAEFVLTCHLRHEHELSGLGQNQLKLVSRVMRRIHENPAEFDPAPIVAQAGYTMDHFRRIFKRVVGHTPHRVQIEARIERAKYLLEGSDLSIGAIAEDVGYANIYYFSLQFKQLVGITPSTYRKQHRG